MGQLVKKVKGLLESNSFDAIFPSFVSKRFDRDTGPHNAGEMQIYIEPNGISNQVPS
jgi:hypothetical protein